MRSREGSYRVKCIGTRTRTYQPLFVFTDGLLVFVFLLCSLQLFLSSLVYFLLFLLLEESFLFLSPVEENRKHWGVKGEDIPAMPSWSCESNEAERDEETCKQ